MKVVELPGATLIQTGPNTYRAYNKDGEEINILDKMRFKECAKK